MLGDAIVRKSFWCSLEISVALSIILLSMIASCSNRNKGMHAQLIYEKCNEREDCSLLSSELQLLSPQERCQAELLLRRCNPSDRCIVQCMIEKAKSGKRTNCYHECTSYFVRVQGVLSPCNWVPPEGWEQCAPQNSVPPNNEEK